MNTVYCVATSPKAAVQQLAMWAQKGHFYFLSGTVSTRKPPAETDAALMKTYHAHWDKFKRARQKKEGIASVHYLRLGGPGGSWCMCATEGKTEIHRKERGVRDIRRKPFRFAGHEITAKVTKTAKGYKTEVTIRIPKSKYQDLRAYVVDRAKHHDRLQAYRTIRHACRKWALFSGVRYQCFALIKAYQQVTGEHPGVSVGFRKQLPVWLDKPRQAGPALPPAVQAESSPAALSAA